MRTEGVCESHRSCALMAVYVCERYIQDVSKAMAQEVRQLMQEVGQLRDERQKLQRCVLPSAR